MTDVIEPPFIWCVVANVTRDPHPEGPDGEMRLGTRRFAPGAKLYCFPINWGDGGKRLRVLGRHRGGGPKLIDVVVSTKWLTGWRAMKVYQPFVVREMGGPFGNWDDTEASRERAIRMAKSFAGDLGQRET